jgi:LCP family protein required for cell wall assembly
MPARGPVPPGGGTSRGAPNENNLLSLGRAIERRGGGRARARGRRRRWVLWTGVTLASLVVLVIAAVLADYFYLNSLLTRRPVSYEQQGGSATNILLVGSTDRCSLKQQNAAYGLCDEGVTGVNSDIVMILHLDNGKASLLSIPRDLFEPNAREGGQANKIDAALYQGPSQLAAAVEEDFAIPINHFVELNFDTFADVVNAIGGIDMYFPMRVYDAESGLNIERPYCYHLDGVHALQVVRARHLQIGFTRDGNDPHNWPYEQLSDLARIRRTHEFLRVVADRIAAMGVDNPFQDQSLATAVLPHVTVDDGFSEPAMVGLAETYHAVSISKTPQLTYPVVINYGDPAIGGAYLYKGGNYGDVEFPVQPGGWQTVDAVFGAGTDDSPWNGKALPVPGGFHVSVEDGSGVPNQQSTIAQQLGAKGFHVTQTGVWTPVGPSAETVVWYGGPPPPASGNWVSASQAAALRVMSTLEGPVTLGYDPAMVTHGDMVTVQTGSALSVATRDWTAPPTTTTTSSTSTSTSTSSTTPPSTTPTTQPVTATTVLDPPGISTDDGLSKPSDTAQPLEPWDPRACAPDAPVLVDRSGDG